MSDKANERNARSASGVELAFTRKGEEAHPLAGDAEFTSIPTEDDRLLRPNSGSCNDFTVCLMVVSATRFIYKHLRRSPN